MPSAGQSRFRVGDWLVDPTLHQIRRDGRQLSLPPKAMDLLLLLSSRPNEVVSFEDIIEAVWNGVLVSDSSIYNAVNDLRKALDDSREAPIYIETISRRGYRLIAEVDLNPKQRSGAPSPAHGATSIRRVLTVLIPMGLTITIAALLISGTSWIDPAPGEIEISLPVGRLPNSVAVLPFEHLGPDPDDAFFAAGVHGELLNQLARIRDIAVISRTSVMQFAGAQRPIEDIAEELNVETVMEGSVRYSDDQVRIAVQLIDGQTGSQLWSQAYDGDLTDIFSIQYDIALNITQAMKAQFDVDEQAAISRRPTSSLEAYTHYMRARSLVATLGPREPIHAELDKALVLDPQFAVAIALKAMLRAYQANLAFGGTRSSAEQEKQHIETAQILAGRALEIDPYLAEAYVALGFSERYYRRWDSSLANFERAYNLDPGSLTTVAQYASELGARGRTAEMIDLRELAITIDPLNPAIRGGFAINLMWAQQFDLAREVLRDLLALAPDVGVLHVMIGALESCAGNKETALEMAQRAETLPLGLEDRINLMEVYRRLDRPQDVQRLHKALTKSVPAEQLGPWEHFLIYEALGDYDSAVTLLGEIVETNFPAHVVHFHRFYGPRQTCDPITQHPGYQAIVKNLGMKD